MKKFATFILVITIVTALGMCGYALQVLGVFGDTSAQPAQTLEGSDSEPEQPTFTSSIPGSYDSMDEVAVVMGINQEEQTITLRNTDLQRNYTLDYSQATRLEDRYGSSLSIAQIREGDLVQVTFLKNKKRLNTLFMCGGAAWTYEKAKEYAVNRNTKVLTLVTDSYKIGNDTLIFSQGKQIDWIELNDVDVLTVNGIDQHVYSIVVEKGHGYLRLENDTYFVGGWIEVGESLISPITQDMLLTVPEGDYQVLLTNNGNRGVKNISIKRGEELDLDIGDIEIEETKVGRVVFSVTPGNASIYVDGELVDVGAPLELEYGIHQMIAGADGYDTMTRYINVGEELASLDIRLEKTSTVSGNSSSGTSTSSESGNSSGNGTSSGSGNSSGNGTSSGSGTGSVISATNQGQYHVMITAPEKVELYVDGNYIGITPISFKKVAGSHVITLRKDGYVTRSYTIQVDEEQKDISYSFADLTAGSVSGN